MKRSIQKSLILLLLALALTSFGIAGQRDDQRTAVGRVTGTYKFVLNSLEVLELPDGKVRISFAGFWPNDRKRVETRNSGAFDETVALDGKTATVKIQFGNDPCTIKLEFQPSKVIVEQEGSLTSCGFGFNVEPNGTYTRVSSKPPKLPAQQ